MNVCKDAWMSGCMDVWMRIYGCIRVDVCVLHGCIDVCMNV